MLILFDHECTQCAHVFEEMVEGKLRDAIPCPRCRAPSNRLITGSRIDPRLGIHADSFPTMGDKWARMRIQRQKIEAKRAADHGE